MGKYHVTVVRTEIYADSVWVEAEEERVAHDIVRKALDAGEYEVGDDCYSRTEIEIEAEAYDPRWHDDLPLEEAAARREVSEDGTEMGERQKRALQHLEEVVRGLDNLED